MNLNLIARKFSIVIDRSMILLGVYPRWEVGLDRTYDKKSPEWIEFDNSLKKIKELSDSRGLKPPVFADLLQTHPDSKRYRFFVQLWHHQARDTAGKHGFVVVSFDEEVGKMSPEEIPVNSLDGHPSVKLHYLYANKLYVIVKDIFQD